MDLPKTDLEAWENVVEGTVVVSRFDHLGQPSKNEIIYPGRTLSISSEERKFNETDRCADTALNPFRNGMLRPVRLIEDSEDAQELASNPNVMSESDMITLVKGHHKTFGAKLDQIKNGFALQRLLKVATDPANEAPFSRVQAIQARLDSLNPNVVEVTSVGTDPGGPNPVSPR